VSVLLLATAGVGGQTIPEEHLKIASPPVNSYQPITGRQRITWFAQSTVGPESLVAGLFSAGFGTALNRPIEYGPHWEGFGKRDGMPAGDRY